MTGFAALGVPSVIVRALEKMGYETPTPVQREGIPPALTGGDVLLEAETGSGKTAAFGIPAVIRGSEGKGLRVIVLVPTRELARQVAEEIREIGTGSPFRCVAVTGGVHTEAEARTLGGDIRCVVATPGRLIALLDEGTIKLQHLKLLVLDEADRMLDMGFKDEVEKVLAAADKREQTLLVSATLGGEVVDLAKAHTKNAQEVRIGQRAAPVSLAHFRLNVMVGQKDAASVALLKKEAPQRAIAFVATRKRAVEFAKLFRRAGIAVDRLEGDMTHEQRRHVFDLFQRGVTHVLVATDLASRGLDVPEMELVLNIDVPEEKDSYLHRAGRAARLGRPGRVVTMVLPDEKNERLMCEREAGVTFTPYRLEFSEADLPQDPAAPPGRRPAGRPGHPPRRGRDEPPRDARPPKRSSKPERVPRVRDAPAGDDVPASRRDRKRRE